uniref:carbamoyl-phosphate synthase small subunit n=1 Tax=Acidisphaera sp. L21 TaxID=1641851 RepID=UPI00131C9A78
MPSVEEIIAQIGGPDAAARLTGVGHEAIRKWRQSRAIPSKHWAAIVAATGLAFADLQPTQSSSPMPQSETTPPGATAVLVLADGSVFWGRGFGAHSSGRVGELCFNTGMTGYQETLTDASYAGQIITFTFPHIGNVGTNPGDMEAINPAALGLVVKQDVTEPSNWRSIQTLDAWLKAQDMPGLGGVDTRALTLRIRDGGPPNAVIAFPGDGKFDIPALTARAQAWPGLEGMDLAKQVSCTQSYEWDEGTWSIEHGFQTQTAPKYHVVAVDYGAKRNILRSLASAGCRVTVVPACATAEDILRHKPDGVFLSNG